MDGRRTSPDGHPDGYPDGLAFEQRQRIPFTIQATRGIRGGNYDRLQQPDDRSRSHVSATQVSAETLEAQRTEREQSVCWSLLFEISLD